MIGKQGIGLWVLVLAACALLSPCYAQVDADENAEQSEGDAAKKWYRGSLDLSLDFWASEHHTDIMMDQVLRLEITPPKNDRLVIRGALWSTEDLDGHESTTSSLRGLKDAYGAAVQVKVLHLYAEFSDIFDGADLRIGRQYITQSPVYPRIDGLYLRQRQEYWDWYVFGGARASIYRDAHKDLSTGGGIGAWATRKTRLSLDWFYGRDDRRQSETVSRGPLAGLLDWVYPREIDGTVDSFLLAFTVDHQLGPRHRLRGRFTMHDGASDELLLSAAGFLGAREAVYDITYRRRFDAIEDRANDATGYYRLLGTQDEFDDISASFHIPLAEHHELSLDAQYHNSHGQSGFEPYDQDFWRLGATWVTREIWPGIETTATVERWDADLDEGSWLGALTVAKQWERTRATFGASYETYRYRVYEYDTRYQLARQLANLLIPGVYTGYQPLVSYLDTSRVHVTDDVISAFAEVEHQLSPRQRLFLRLNYEHFDDLDGPIFHAEVRYMLQF